MLRMLKINVLSVWGLKREDIFCFAISDCPPQAQI